MMMGHGSYVPGGPSPSSTSNLSPLAAPFTVDRFVPKSIANPLVDLTETSYGVTFSHSLHNWLGAQPSNSRPDYFSSAKPELDTVPASNAYIYLSSAELVAPLNPHVSASIDTGLYSQNSSGFVEAKPYYPSYVSTEIGTGKPLDIANDSGYDLLSTSHVATQNGSLHEDYTQSLSGLERSAHWAGLWEGLTNWQQGEHVQLDGNFCSKETYVNQGLYASEGKGKGKFEEASHSVDAVSMEKQTESGGREQLDCKSFLSEIPKFTPSIYPTSASSTSTLLVTETCPSVPSIKPVNSWNHQMPYGASYERCSRKHDGTPCDIASIINASPAVVMRSAIQDAHSLTNMNSAGDVDNKAFPGYNASVVIEPHQFMSSNFNSTIGEDNKAFFSIDTSVVMEPDPFMSSKGSLCYDASLFGNHVEQNEVISGFSLENNKELSRSEGVSVDALDQLSGKRSRIQVHCSSLQGHDLVGDKTEGINSVKNHSENLDHHNPAVDSPCWKGVPVTHFSEDEISEALPPQSNKKLEVYRGSNLQVHQILTLSGDDTIKISPDKTSKNLMQQESWSKGNCLAPSLKAPMVDNINLREGINDTVRVGPHHSKPNCFDGVKITDDSLPKKYSFDNKLPHNKLHTCEGNKWTAEKSFSVGNDVTDVGKNVNDDPGECSSHVPFHAIEHVLCSLPSADDELSKFTEPHGGDSTGKMYIRTLIDTMQNLSELLVFHFSNNACELKNDDHEAVKDVINNLELCMLKKVDRTESATSQLLGNSSQHKKDPNGNGSQISETHPFDVRGLGKNQRVQENYNIVSGKNNEKLSNVVSSMAAADILKDDKMTQALKKALIENFNGEEETEPQVLLYKNLWLEAEASLCAASCIAHFNRMKKVMETNGSQNAKDNQSSAPFSPENTVGMDKLSRFKVSVDPNEVNLLASDAKGSPLPDVPISESPILSASSHADDVAARFHILKCHVDTSNSENTSYVDNTLGSAEKLSTSEDSPIPNGVDKLAFDEKAEMSIQETAISCVPSHVDDLEVSVMRRFNILKLRVDNLTSMDREEHQAANVDLGYAGLQRQLPTVTDRSEDRVLDVDMEPHSQSHPFNCTEDKLAVKEFHPIAKDDSVIQTRTVSMPGDQSHAALCDGSSDWEHVLLEELAGQSS